MSPNNGPVLVLGAGPGLGMAVARRFGRAGQPVVLVSRSANRHAGYVRQLTAAGIDAMAIAADLHDLTAIADVVARATDRFGPIETVYYGPGAADPTARPAPIEETTVADVEAALRAMLLPAVAVTELVAPGMRQRRSGSLLFATGLASVVPLPMLGAFAPTSAALRTWALTLHTSLADDGVHVAALVLGGLIRGGDIHRHAVAAAPEAMTLPELDPEEIAEAAWRLTVERDQAEAVFNALTA
ncbi:SDR family NAD(P)-dependent oxidoreductase [Labedaea rhizosphaerae]|uniref:Short-subunit dehydrogenase n=1 Tax=Labedaea rhizosphaerae TaxID=598644 RepID=A0A4R6SDH9_LABRH|nr:SDR family NAD(P)-dependent oxidoreductase [Labedaea rhizosphaerae]TDP97727.1 short-subunit dehydrogenase [Labedaea rhizosphaerae]